MDINTAAMKEMPRYVSHKIVHALKIVEISLADEDEGAEIVPEGDYAPFMVSQEYYDKHQPQAGGYYVQYKDGYKSFSPAKAFEEGYTSEDKMYVSKFQTKGMNFGQAIEALKDGKMITRPEWDGKFIFRQIPSEISIDIVANMQSLPDSVKLEFAKRYNIPNDGQDHELCHTTIRYKNQLAMVYPDNTIYGWVASPSDCLENDWCIL